jgi:hypothetical protein
MLDRVKPDPVPRELPPWAARSRQTWRAAGTAAPATKPFWGIHETTLKQTAGTYTANKAAESSPGEAHMNHSIHSADRSTHLKIVVMALVAGIVVAGIGISARTNADYSQTAHIIKAGKPVAVTSSDAMVVR